MTQIGEPDREFEHEPDEQPSWAEPVQPPVPVPVAP
jgi:hypothetical protein